jgi:hypothetical protein
MSKSIKIICQLCKEEKELIKAHIIPRAFYKDAQLTFDKKELRLVERGGNYKKVPVTGYFDKDILCGACDSRLGKWEDELIALLRRDKSYKYNYSSIKLAVLGILWKAHIIKNQAFEEINLGPLEEQFYIRIKNGDAGAAEVFPIWIHRYKNVHNTEGLCLRLVEVIILNISPDKFIMDNF